jgi:hypothetical protein
MASAWRRKSLLKPFVKKSEQRGLKAPLRIYWFHEARAFLRFSTMATFPTLHLNGTGKNDLRDGYADAYDAIDKAIEALAAATLNGRDYYPQAEGAYYQARRERDAALDQLRQAHQYAGEMLAGICDQM